jgi:hypothetical protein
LATWLNYWDVILAGAGALACLIAMVLGLGWVQDWQRRAIQRRLRLELRNLGNVRTRYEVWADDPAGSLALSLSLAGAKGRPVVVAAPRPAPAARQPGVNGSNASPRRNIPGAGLGSGLANLLGEVAYLLPGQLGASVRSLESRLRRARYSVSRAQYTLDSVGRAAQKAGTVGEQMAARTAPAAPVEAAPPADLRGLHTDMVEPGSQAVIMLEATPARAMPSQTSAVRVFSRPLDAPEPAVLETAAQIEMRQLGWARRYLPPAAIVLAGLVGAGGCIVFILWAFGFIA